MNVGPDLDDVEGHMVRAVHMARNDHHFAEFLLEIILYEIAAAIPTTKTSQLVRFDTLQKSIVVAHSFMRTYGDDPGATVSNPTPMYDMFVATAPFAPTLADMYLYLKDEWRVSRLLMKEIGLDSTPRASVSQHPISCTLPALTKEDHEHFKKTFARIRPEFQDRYAAIVHACRKYIWRNNGSGGESVMLNGLWGVEKYTKKYNLEYSKSLADAAAAALVAAETGSASASTAAVNGDEVLTGEKSKAALKKAKRKAKKALQDENNNNSSGKDSPTPGQVPVPADTAPASSATINAPKSSTKAASKPAAAKDSSQTIPRAPPAEDDDEELTHARQVAAELVYDMEMAQHDPDMLRVLAIQWKAKHTQIMTTIMSRFNREESRRRRLLDQARKRAREANQSLEGALKKVCQISRGINTEHERIQSLIRVERDALIQSIAATGKNAGEKVQRKAAKEVRQKEKKAHLEFKADTEAKIKEQEEKIKKAIKTSGLADPESIRQETDLPYLDGIDRQMPTLAQIRSSAEQFPDMDKFLVKYVDACMNLYQPPFTGAALDRFKLEIQLGSKENIQAMWDKNLPVPENVERFIGKGVSSGTLLPTDGFRLVSKVGADGKIGRKMSKIEKMALAKMTWAIENMVSDPNDLDKYSNIYDENGDLHPWVMAETGYYGEEDFYDEDFFGGYEYEYGDYSEYDDEDDVDYDDGENEEYDEVEVEDKKHMAAGGARIVEIVEEVEASGMGGFSSRKGTPSFENAPDLEEETGEGQASESIVESKQDKKGIRVKKVIAGAVLPIASDVQGPKDVEESSQADLARDCKQDLDAMDFYTGRDKYYEHQYVEEDDSDFIPSSSDCDGSESEDDEEEDVEVDLVECSKDLGPYAEFFGQRIQGEEGHPTLVYMVDQLRQDNRKQFLKVAEARFLEEHGVEFDGEEDNARERGVEAIDFYAGSGLFYEYYHDWGSGSEEEDDLNDSDYESESDDDESSTDDEDEEEEVDTEISEDELEDLSTMRKAEDVGYLRDYIWENYQAIEKREWIENVCIRQLDPETARHLRALRLERVRALVNPALGECQLSGAATDATAGKSLDGAGSATEGGKAPITPLERFRQKEPDLFYLGGLIRDAVNQAADSQSVNRPDVRRLEDSQPLAKFKAEIKAQADTKALAEMRAHTEIKFQAEIKEQQEIKARAEWKAQAELKAQSETKAQKEKEEAKQTMAEAAKVARVEAIRKAQLEAERATEKAAEKIRLAAERAAERAAAKKAAEEKERREVEAILAAERAEKAAAEKAVAEKVAADKALAANLLAQQASEAARAAFEQEEITKRQDGFRKEYAHYVEAMQNHNSTDKDRQVRADTDAIGPVAGKAYDLQVAEEKEIQASVARFRTDHVQVVEVMRASTQPSFGLTKAELNALVQTFRGEAAGSTEQLQETQRLKARMEARVLAVQEQERVEQEGEAKRQAQAKAALKASRLAKEEEEERLKEEANEKRRLRAAENYRLKEEAAAVAITLAAIRGEPVALPNNGQIFYDWQGLNFGLSLWKVPREHFPLMQVWVDHWYKQLVPGPEAGESRANLLLRLQGLFDQEYPGKGLQLRAFGSYVTGLGNNWSDIDICIFSDDFDPFAPHSDVRHLAQFLRSQQMQNVVAITDAKVPIIKFVDPQSSLSCDMNVQHPLGIYNSKLIKAYMEIDPRLGQFLYVLKHFAGAHGILDGSTGFLCSYAYILMAIVFFQEQKEPILPRLQSWSERPKQVNANGRSRKKSPTYGTAVRDGTVQTILVMQAGKNFDVTFDTRTELYKGFGQRNPKTVAQLLFEFFEYFGRKFDYRTMEVNAQNGRVQERHAVSKQRKAQVAMEDRTKVRTLHSGQGGFVFDQKRRIWLNAEDQARLYDLEVSGIGAGIGVAAAHAETLASQQKEEESGGSGGSPSSSPLGGASSSSASSSPTVFFDAVSELSTSTTSTTTTTNTATTLSTTTKNTAEHAAAVATATLNHHATMGRNMMGPPGPGGYPDRFGTEAFLCVMDPFILNRNVAGTCRGPKLGKVWKCFDHAYKCFGMGKFAEAFQPLEQGE